MSAAVNGTYLTEADVLAQPGDMPHPTRLPRLRKSHFYHRRHKAIKKEEKRQQRHEYLELAASQQIAPTRGVDAEQEAAWHRQEWLQRNLPVMPPTHASLAARGSAGGPRTAHYSAEDLQASWSTGYHKDTRSLEVLSLKVGYSRDAEYALPEEVKAFILDQTTFCLYGLDKSQVSQIAANIRRIRPPEPYKGRGIRIVGESVKTKDRKVK